MSEETPATTPDASSARPKPPADGVTRMNVSIPGELKRKMDRVREPVNWSRVAADAFRLKMKELAAARGGPTDADAVTRLQAAGRLENEQAHSRGYEAGQAWVRERATPKQVTRLLGRFSEVGGNTAGVMLRQWQTRHKGIARPLIELIAGREFDHQVEFEQACETLLGSPLGADMNDPDYVHGFIDGVSYVWGVLSKMMVHGGSDAQ